MHCTIHIGEAFLTPLVAGRKTSHLKTKKGPASGLCVALQSQLFSLGGQSSKWPALQASKCSTLARPFCTLLFVYGHPGGKDPTRIGLDYSPGVSNRVLSV